RERIIGTLGFYDPMLNLTLQWNSSEQPNTSILDAGQGIPTRIFKRWVFNTSLNQNVPGGGALTVDFNNDRFTTNSAFNFINPQYGADFGITFTQPLWKGFLETQTERQIKIFNLDTEISDRQFEQRVSEVIQQVENQYWELVFAIENYEARRHSLQLALIQYENNQRRVEIGVMAPIEITASRAEAAAREQEMIQSEVQIINAQNALKHLLAPDPQASIWNVTLLPTDQPVVQDVTVTLEEAINTALQRRPELDQIRLRLSQNEVDRAYFRNQGKPAVNLIAGLISTGTSGEVFMSQLADLDGDGVPETPVGQVPNPNSPFYGNFSDAWSQAFGYNYLTYNVGLNVQIPIRNRTSEAQLAEVAITERQLRSEERRVGKELRYRRRASTRQRSS